MSFSDHGDVLCRRRGFAVKEDVHEADRWEKLHGPKEEESEGPRQLYWYRRCAEEDEGILAVSGSGDDINTTANDRPRDN